MSAGARFRAALEAEKPLQIAGTINAYTALLAERAGFKAIYLSGAGVANASFGLPDLAMTTLNDVSEDIRRIASATKSMTAILVGMALDAGRFKALDQPLTDFLPEWKDTRKAAISGKDGWASTSK